MMSVADCARCPSTHMFCSDNCMRVANYPDRCLDSCSANASFVGMGTLDCQRRAQNPCPQYAPYCSDNCRFIADDFCAQACEPIPLFSYTVTLYLAILCCCIMCFVVILSACRRTFSRRRGDNFGRVHVVLSGDGAEELGMYRYPSVENTLPFRRHSAVSSPHSRRPSNGSLQVGRYVHLARVQIGDQVPPPPPGYGGARYARVGTVNGSLSEVAHSSGVEVNGDGGQSSSSPSAAKVVYDPLFMICERVDGSGGYGDPLAAGDEGRRRPDRQGGASGRDPLFISPSEDAEGIVEREFAATLGGRLRLEEASMQWAVRDDGPEVVHTASRADPQVSRAPPTTLEVPVAPLHGSGGPVGSASVSHIDALLGHHSAGSVSTDAPANPLTAASTLPSPAAVDVSSAVQQSQLQATLGDVAAVHAVPPPSHGSGSGGGGREVDVPSRLPNVSGSTSLERSSGTLRGRNTATPTVQSTTPSPLGHHGSHPSEFGVPPEDVTMVGWDSDCDSVEGGAGAFAQSDAMRLGRGLRVSSEAGTAGASVSTRSGAGGVSAWGGGVDGPRPRVVDAMVAPLYSAGGADGRLHSGSWCVGGEAGSSGPLGSAAPSWVGGSLASLSSTSVRFGVSMSPTTPDEGAGGAFPQSRGARGGRRGVRVAQVVAAGVAARSEGTLSEPSPRHA